MLFYFYEPTAKPLVVWSRKTGISRNIYTLTKHAVVLAPSNHVGAITDNPSSHCDNAAFHYRVTHEITHPLIMILVSEMISPRVEVHQ